MKSFLTIVLAIIAAALVSFILAKPGETSTTKTVYQDVLERGTLRCGYFEEAPFTFREPNTGAMSGLAVELTEKIAEDLELKVEWVEPINFGTFVTDLANKRYDAVCGSIFMLPRAGKLDFSIPYAIAPLYGYVRPDNNIFDRPFDQIDWKAAKIAGLDGEGATTMARKLLPDAQWETLPQTAQISDMLLSVAQNKADIGFVMPGVFATFDKNNPQLLRQAQLDKPLYRFSVAFGIKPEEQGLKNMVDARIREYMKTGELDALFKKYDPDNFFIRPRQ